MARDFALLCFPLINSSMKNLYQSIFLIAVALCLLQCDENVAPSESPAFQDAKTEALARKEFVLNAITAPESGFPPNNFMISLIGKAGTTINVDWGDGTSEQLVLESGYPPGYGFLNLSRLYENEGSYKVTFTGDLKGISGFRSAYGQGVFDSADFSALIHLESVRIGLTSGPEILDFSGNKQLIEVWLTNVNQMAEVILPKNHQIKSFSFDGPNMMTTAGIDAVIENIYTNAVRGQSYNGSFSARKLFYLNEGDEGFNDFVGPPSPSGMAKLRSLQNEYGWGISPYIE
jgi:hypothetical protein